MSEEKLRILMAAEDSQKLMALLSELFPDAQKSPELTLVSGVSTLMASLAVVNPEVILLDLALANPNPLEAVRVLHRAAPEVPLIVIAGVAEKRYAAQSLGLGALDCMLKEHMDARTFARILRAALELNTLEGLADLLRDPETGLYIRDGFLTLGSRAMEKARLNDSTLVLLCMRVENLPLIRAKFGRSVAESSLREVGTLLASSFRRTDILARVGESQFAALAIDAVEPSGPVLCQRLKRRITVLNRDTGPWGPLELRMSVGFWSPVQTISFSQFLDEVETGLRRAPEAKTVPCDGVLTDESR